MVKFKVVSFDLEGTLVDVTFSEMVWNEGVPKLFALKTGLSFEEAKSIVSSEYGRVGEDCVEWYDIMYWFGKFGLSSPESLLEAYKGYVRFFPEVEEALNGLSCRFRLVLTTNSNRLFIKVLAEKIMRYFQRTFSATSDFTLLKRNPEFYRRICAVLKVRPDEVVHVGDRLIDDFHSPRSAGINAYLLRRTLRAENYESAGYVIADLRELAEKIRVNP